MVHSSLSAIGIVEGGAPTIIEALIGAIGQTGTLVMPAFRGSISVDGVTNHVSEEIKARARVASPFQDPKNTPTTMGIIPETFRLWPDVQHSGHPTTPIIALGPYAGELTAHHPIDWSTGKESPFHLLYEYNARLLLLGVGFNRLTMLHYAESIIPKGRRKTRVVPTKNGIVLAQDTGDDLNTHFPAIGDELIKRQKAATGLIGDANSTLISSKDTVAFATIYLKNALSDEV